jgi:oxygen-independent coproporphyrinogen-3 oxidase
VELPIHHLYVHVPFCRLGCAYCDFVTVGGRAADIPRYVAALRRELALRPAPGELQTIYFGGGTPSLLAARDVAALVGTAQDRWGIAALKEVTLEANPSTRETPDWTGLRSAGVTRISLGIQSLRDKELQALTRGHSAEEARAAYRAVREAGFDNVSVDLIYGVPGQTLADWRDGLAGAVALEPDHISCYALQLALDPDEWAARPRPGAIRWRQRMARRQDDALAANQYRAAEELLEAAGFRHYELSSWARPGRESYHNTAYWARRPYTGIGAGAHSYDGHGRRSWSHGDLDAYLAAIADGRLPPGGEETLDEPTRAFEAIALGLRRIDGIDREAFAHEFGADPVDRFGVPLAASASRGLVEITPDRMRLTSQGRLLASEVCLGLLPDLAA